MRVGIGGERRSVKSGDVELHMDFRVSFRPRDSADIGRRRMIGKGVQWCNRRTTRPADAVNYAKARP
jgi:hypothetical protein